MDHTSEREGQEKRVDRKVWEDLESSCCRIFLMKELIKYDVGFNDLEEFKLDLLTKLRSDRVKSGVDKVTRKLVKSAMLIKLRDEEKHNERLRSEKRRRMRVIGELLTKNSRPYRRYLKELNDAAGRKRTEQRRKFENKLEHLKHKYKLNEDDAVNEVPAGLEEFKNLSVFDRGKFEEVQTEEKEVLCLSENVSLSEEERMVLRLHTKSQ